MKNNQQIKSLITSFSGHNNMISFPKIYLVITNDINSALLLNQIIFWSDRSKRNDGYFYKSYADWADEIMLTKYQIKRAATKLENIGFISTKIKKANNAPTIHYRANMNEIKVEVLAHLDSQQTSLSDSQQTSLSDSQQTSLSDSKETSLSSITVDYLTDDYTDEYTPSKSDALDSEFLDWWNLYDKKIDRKKALQKFKQCRKKHSLDEILKGTRAYLKTITDKKYQKHPTTFLNGESYLDIEGYKELNNVPAKFDEPTFLTAEEIEEDRRFNEELNF